MKGHDIIGLLPVSDSEWLNEVPDELVGLYCNSDMYTAEGLVEFKRKYPRWFKKEE